MAQEARNEKQSAEPDDLLKKTLAIMGGIFGTIIKSTPDQKDLYITPRFQKFFVETLLPENVMRRTPEETLTALKEFK